MTTNFETSSNHYFLKKLTQGINQLSIGLFSLFCVIFLIWLFLLGFSQYDGDEILKVFFYNPFISLKRISSILLVFGPLLIGSIVVWICFRVGIINLGVGGQMSASALTAYFTAYFLKQTSIFGESDPLMWLPLLFLTGVFSAVLLSCLCGVLKVYFGVNEILSTIFVNYIVFYVFRYLITLNQIVNPITKMSTKTELGTAIGFNVQFVIFSVTFIIALIIFIFTLIIFYQTKFGFQISVMGKNHKAAQYGGINIAKTTMTIFFISGVLAGIAGLFYYYREMKNTNLYKSEAFPSNGFDTIAIVCLSQSSLIALPITTFLIALIRTQQKLIKISSVDPVIIDIMIGLIILVVAFFSKLFNNPQFLGKMASKFKIWKQSLKKIKPESSSFVVTKNYSPTSHQSQTVLANKQNKVFSLLQKPKKIKKRR